MGLQTCPPKSTPISMTDPHITEVLYVKYYIVLFCYMCELLVCVVGVFILHTMVVKELLSCSTLILKAIP